MKPLLRQGFQRVRVRLQAEPGSVFAAESATPPGSANVVAGGDTAGLGKQYRFDLRRIGSIDRLDYATPAFAGAVLYVLLLDLSPSPLIAVWFPVLTIFGLRVMSLRYGWGVPTVDLTQ